jgi:protein phosphatase
LDSGHTSLRLIVAGKTHPGQRRPLNEDVWRIAQADTRPLWQDRGWLCAIADGMGGHAAGEVASQLASVTLLQTYYGAEDVPFPPAMRLEQAILAANLSVYEQSAVQDGQAGMGTTIVAAVVHGDWLTIGNVGDSRAYLIRAGQAIQITRDHSWVAEQVAAGALTEEQARGHIYRNVVTRCLGHRPTIQVDLYDQPLRSGDGVLLCSDGLSNQVSDAEIADLVTGLAPDRATDRLIDLANERGGPDNITAVVIKVLASTPEGEPLEFVQDVSTGDVVPGDLQESAREERIEAIDSDEKAERLLVAEGATQAAIPEQNARSRTVLLVVLIALFLVLCASGIVVLTLEPGSVNTFLSPLMPASFSPILPGEMHTAAP